jgi:cyclopropane fatty-acyl-phospholipid synthase-like methyltransferase
VTDRERLHRTAQDAFEERWSRGEPWDHDTSEFERAKYRRQLELLADRGYGRALEIGCGAGHFTRLLAGAAERVLALDIAPSAIVRAARTTAGLDNVELRVANVMEFDPRADGPWDVVVMSETIYCLGWLYSLFDVGWMASQLLDAISPGGRFLMANTFGKEADYLLLPWLIRTYRDLFAHIGYRLEHEEVCHGTKEGVEYDTLISLYTRPVGGS